MILRGQMDSAEAMRRMLQQGRLLRGITQRELAEELGISQRYVYEIESGKPTIFAERLFQMMRATGVRSTPRLTIRPMTDLRVELYGHLVGHLVGGNSGTFDFVTIASHTTTLLSIARSCQKPCRSTQCRTGHERQGDATFFAELLSEGDSLEFLTERLRLSPSDTIGILRAYGRDTAAHCRYSTHPRQESQRRPRSGR